MNDQSDIASLVREDILALKPYSSARSEFGADGEVFLDANESPFDSGYNRYPDPLQKMLKVEVSKLKQIATEKIFLGNGSDEAIDLIIRIFCNPGTDAILFPEPTYGMYRVSAGINRARIDTCSMTDRYDLKSETLLQSVTPETKIVFLCSPNNPSGNLLDAKQVEVVLQKFSGIVVIDEAYIDFASSPSWMDKLELYPRLIILQTFSKAWGLAGLRVGMAFASPFIIDLLNKIKPPYNLSSLVQETLLQTILEAKDEVKVQVQSILDIRARLAEQLTQFHFVQEVFPSDANFLLTRVTDPHALYQFLISEGIIVRNRSSVHLCDGCLRITIGTDDENAKLIQSLNKYSRQ